MKCAACGSTQFGFEFEVNREDPYRKILGDDTPRARYRECLGCRALCFAGEVGFEEAYTSGDYYGIEGIPELFFDTRFEQILSLPRRKSDNWQRVKRIRRFLGALHSSVPSDFLVCDVGAGMGIFLYSFLLPNWGAVAIEPEPHAACYLRKILPHVEVLEGYSENFTFAERFHLVTYNRVLEHIPDPISALRVELARLREDGVLYVEVPDTRSYYDDGPDNEAFGYGHFMIYSPLALLKVTESAGFETYLLGRCLEPSGKYTLYGFFRPRKSL